MSNFNALLVEQELLWESQPIPSGSLEHPVWISSDWPPLSDFDRRFYRITHDENDNKAWRLEQLYAEFKPHHGGFTLREAKLTLLS